MYAKRTIIFDIWSSYAYFRRVYTTTSATTYPFPPRSSIEGLIAAIIGYESSFYPNKLNFAMIGIALLNDISKMPFSLHYTHTDFWKNVVSKYLKTGKYSITKSIRAPRSIELLREPKYRIFFSIDDEDIMNKLGSMLRNHEAIYLPYLGKNSMLANFELIDSNAVSQPQHIPNDKYEPVSSIIPFKGKMPKLRVQKGIPYAIEHDIPGHLSAERELAYSYSAVYSPLGGKEILASGILIHKVTYSDSRCNNIVFIPAMGSPS